MEGKKGGREVASKDMAVFTREPVVIGPGESILSLGKKTAKVGRSRLSSRESLSKPALCLLRNPGARPARTDPLGRAASRLQQKAAEPHTRHVVAAVGAGLPMTALATVAVPRTPL